MQNSNPENIAVANSDAAVTLDTILGWLRHRADGLYGGEAVTQLEHALQCASLAQTAGATPALVIAALLHDLGHLADSGNDEKIPHGKLAARLLSGLFGRDVTEPIRLHIDAKRYLCATDSSYWSTLSDASKRSLEWQGGLFSRQDAENFIEQPYSNDAIRLRLWDDAAKVPGAPTPALEAFIPVMQTVMHSTSFPHAETMNRRALPNIDLREAILADADTLAALLAQMDDDEPQHAPDFDGKYMREILSDMAAYPDFRAYLVFDRGEPVGSFSLMIFSSPSHRGTRQAMLDAVVVARSRRGAGIGEAMIRRALQIAAGAGCYKMTLSSNLKRVDAHRFYESIGFRQHGISFSMPLATLTA